MTSVRSESKSAVVKTKSNVSMKRTDVRSHEEEEETMPAPPV